MRFCLFFLALLPASASGPSYSLQTTVNAASFLPEFAPNSLVSIFGKNLAWTERWRLDGDLEGGLLPATLPGTYLNVTVNGVPAAVEYASPTQVIFLLPPGLRPGTVQVWVTVAGIRGPVLQLPVQESAPALYLYEGQFVLARRAESYEFITPRNLPLPSEHIVLYANSLGATVPPQRLRVLPREPAEIARRKDFRILLNGEELPPDRIGYVGIMPGFPAFYEIHLQLPDELPPNPEVRACIVERCSQEGQFLPTIKETAATETQPLP